MALLTEGGVYVPQGWDGANWQKVKVDENGNTIVKLTGSSVESVGGSDALRTKQVASSATAETVINALAVRDTAAHDSASLDLSDASDFAFSIFNDTDQDINVSIIDENLNLSISLTAVTAGTVGRITKGLKSELNGPLTGVLARVQAPVAPTTGTVTVVFYKRG